MRETIFRRKQGMVQEVIPDMILSKARERWRLVSLFLRRAQPSKARRRNPVSEDLPIGNGVV